jgi:hypothetical protein
VKRIPLRQTIIPTGEDDMDACRPAREGNEPRHDSGPRLPAGYGDKVILLLGGFDKGAHPNHEKPEVKQAKANLRNWREQQARTKAR